MRRQTAQHFHLPIIHMIWHGLTLSALGLLTLGLWGRGERRLRKSGPIDPDRPPVKDEDRLIEPLGFGVAWGQLDQLDGRYTGVPFLLTRQIFILGRQAGCDIVLEDERASRYHVILTWDHGHGYIQDNNSTNGTLLNGQSVKGAIPLRHGDIIEAAGAEFRFTYAAITGLATIDAQPTEKIALPGMMAHSDRPALHAHLTALTGPEPGRVWPIVSGAVSIGRGGDNIVVLPHASVSRHHAQILVQATGLFVQDIGSSNGTSVNGEPLLAPRPLRDSDHIQVGDILLVVKMDVPAQDMAADPPTQLLSGQDVPRGQQAHTLAPQRAASPHQAIAPEEIPAQPTQQLPLNGATSVPQFRLPPRPQTATPDEKRVPRYRPTRPVSRDRDKPTPPDSATPEA